MAIMTATEYQQSLERSVEQWAGYVLREGDEAIQSERLYGLYSAWRLKQGRKPVSQTTWGRWMGAHYLKSRRNGRYWYLGLTVIEAPEI